jgi:hypothetical protein
MSLYREMTPDQQLLLQSAIRNAEALLVASRAWSRALQLSESVRTTLIAGLNEHCESPAEALEQAARCLLPVDFAQMESQLQGRAETVAAQIAPWLSGDSLLDYGCGDGRIAARCRTDASQVSLYDLDGIGERAADSGERLRAPLNRLADLGRRWDSVLLLTVLHHSDQPQETLRDAIACTAGRLIVIESCVWDDSALLEQHSPITELKGQSARDYATLTDWFYNRVVYSGIPVPFNFAGPQYWIESIERGGLEVIATRDLGVDIPIVPEHHYLIVAQRPGG